MQTASNFIEGQMAGSSLCSGTREGARARLKLLDGCLEVLEGACERGQTSVSAELAMRLRPHVDIQPGTPIPGALDRLFELQQACLSVIGRPVEAAGAGKARVSHMGSRPAQIGHPLPAGADLTVRQARLLTFQIRSATRAVSQLLLLAHDRKAWRALGYRSWRTYVRQELGFSRSRSYELLDHARVVQAIGAAGGLSDFPDISPKTAADLKPFLEDVVQEVRRRCRAAASQQLAERAVLDVVAAVKARRSETGPEIQTANQLARSWRIVARLVRSVAKLPIPKEFDLRTAQDYELAPADLHRVARWLQELAAVLSNQEGSRSERSA